MSKQSVIKQQWPLITIAVIAIVLAAVVIYQQRRQRQVQQQLDEAKAKLEAAQNQSGQNDILTGAGSFLGAIIKAIF